MDHTPFIGVMGGLLNYQGDLQPTSFAFQRARPMWGVSVRQPVSNKFSLKGGFNIGKLSAADRFNRDYLQPRNLSFYSGVQELYLSLDFTLLDLSSYRVSPYAYAGGALFHFNPYTYTASGEKVYLKPLSTEGQGLAAYPDRKEYGLFQPALTFGGGIRYAPSHDLVIALETGQRKSFIDYIDDVSKTYINKDVLLAAKGQQAVDLAFRGDEIHNTAPFPNDGEQRGTPTEMDWYYYAGLSIEVKLHSLGNVLSGFSGGGRFRDKSTHSMRCPRFY